MDQNKQCPKCGQIDKTGFSSCKYCGTKYSALPVQIGLTYAPFSMRAGAFTIDTLLFIIVAVAVFFLAPSSLSEPIKEYFGVFYQLVIMIFDLFLRWMYFALMESSSAQGTLGKMFLGIRVTDMNGQRISFLRATARFFSKFISSLILGLGYLFPLFNARKQALHDMMAGTVVIR
jgi:uncharacterized RDD family membrane protein YckC